MEDAIDKAAQKLGIDKVTSNQKKALDSFLQGNNVFVSLPTGSGKSFIFQAAPICIDFKRNTKSVALVISPLKALVGDQIKSLKTKGISASSLDDVYSTKDHDVSVIFASPESILLENGTGRDKIVSMREKICGIFVDECHVVTQWGHSTKEKAAFRKHYAMLGEVRALIPTRVPLVALTATATEDARRSIIKSLAMYDVVHIIDSPDRTNIKLISLKTKSGKLEDWFHWLIDHLKEHGQACERIIIYCRTLLQCRELYAIFESELCLSDGNKLNFAMFHSETPQNNQTEIIKSFSEVDGHIRVLFSTIAFGMGVDVKGLHTVVHLGVPSDPESFLQESGRAGRDGEQSVSILFMYNGMYKDCKVDKRMKDYAANTESCRRKEVLKHFNACCNEEVTGHRCCDICAAVCKCGLDVCKLVEFSYKSLANVSRKTQNLETMGLHTRVLTEEDKVKLKDALSKHRQLQISNSTQYLAGADISSGIPSQCIDKIVSEAHFVLTLEMFSDRYPIYSNAKLVYDIVISSTKHCQIQDPVMIEEDISNFIPSAPETEDESEDGSVLEDDGINNEDVYISGEYANLCIVYSSDETASATESEEENENEETDNSDN